MIIYNNAARFAEARLQRNGRCHESEIRAALKGEVRRFRSPDSLSSSALRDMIRSASENCKSVCHHSKSDLHIERSEMLTREGEKLLNNCLPLATDGFL